MKLLICVITYDEAENIRSLIDEIFANAPDGARLLVIDDSSPDGTGSIVEELKQKYPDKLFLITRPGKQGVATAFLQGFDFALRQDFDAVLCMDADFSHNPKYIKTITEKAAEYDVVIGSRLVRGGGIENRSLMRDIISRGASVYCRLLLGIPVKDFTGGYNLWTKTALQKIDINSIVTRGYSFQIELKYKAFRANCKITEVPIIFPDRKGGVSKMPASFFARALADVWRIKFSR